MSNKIDSATLETSQLTFATGYSATAGTFAKKVGGVVTLLKTLSVPTITDYNNQTVAFTLPEGFRPIENCNFPVIQYNSTSDSPIARVRIGSDGTVRISKTSADLSSSAYLQLPSIMFMAA